MADTLRYARFETLQALLRARWLLLIPTTGLLVYLSVGRIEVDAINSGWAIASLNQWDLLFHVLGNPYYVLYVLTPLFLVLTADLASGRSLDSAALLCAGSRRRWWTAKCMAVGACALTTVLFLSCITAILGTVAFGWQSGWSQAARQDPTRLGQVTPPTLLLSPLSALLQLCVLLLLGWIALGTLSLVIAVTTGRSVAGLGGSALAVLVGIAGFHSGISGLGAQLSVHTHLLFSLRSVAPEPCWWSSVAWSCAFWCTWTAALWAIGARRSQARDLCAGEVGE
jgi:hypothetical protein